MLRLHLLLRRRGRSRCGNWESWLRIANPNPLSGNVGRRNLDHSRSLRGALVKHDILWTRGEGVGIAGVLVAGENRILPAVGVNRSDRFHAGGNELRHLRLVLAFLLGHGSFDIVVVVERGAALHRRNRFIRRRTDT
jgi:hypothetical protein